jgi:hypothetical protein
MTASRGDQGSSTPPPETEPTVVARYDRWGGRQGDGLMQQLQVRRARGVRYNPETYGLMASRRRLTRVMFVLPEVQAWAQPEDPERSYRFLLDEVFERMGRLALAPLPMPERIRAEWRDEERAFVLHGEGLFGFAVVVDVEAVPEPAEADAGEPEGALAVAGGSDAD